MLDQIALSSTIFNSEEKNTRNLSGLSGNQFTLLFNIYFSQIKNRAPSLYIFPNEDEAERFYQDIKQYHTNIAYFPSIGSDIYSSILPNENNLFKRFTILDSILSENKPDIVCSIDSAFLKGPNLDFFKEKSLDIEVSDVISPIELSEKLVLLGYTKTLTIEEEGTFSNRGEIFDIYPIGDSPKRIYYFDDLIEEIFEVSPTNLKTIRELSYEKFSIKKSPYSILTDERIDIFKNEFPRATPAKKELFEKRKEIFSRLNKKMLFPEYPFFVSYFFNNPQTLFEYAKEYKKIAFQNIDIENQTNYLLDQINLEAKEYIENTDDDFRPVPEKIYDLESLKSFSPNIFINDIQVEMNDFSAKNTNIELSIKNKSFSNSKTKHNDIVNYIKDLKKNNYKVVIIHRDSDALEEIKYILDTIEDKFSQRVIFHKGELSTSFLYESENLFFLSSNDFFAQKTKKARKSSDEFNSDIFADQLSTLEEGDYIIHKDHGVGKYLGIESLTINNVTTDYITLLYLDEDKVYVPVYRLNLLQKYSSSSTTVRLANLKNKKFEQLKDRAQKSVKKLAFDLLELQAKRKLKKGYSFSPPDHEFNKFSLSFKFVETVDQSKAIDDVLDDMQSGRPMDRLVCGDVGFGKTEVAMRASFLSVLDNKQVCILVPTTVLSLQHYNSFIERFKDFPVNIEFLSRFKTPKQSKEIIEKLEEGKIDILIGTHKVLSEKIKFKDLGLMIIDEEQRFGVGHKEKLKLLKENVDTLTLTATPIPRTLQLSFLGIKDLSLIQTPPPKRQSIKTYLIKEDPNTLKIAIEKELSRGGQVFIVHNKVSDIEIYTAKIRELVPKAKIVFAHGQMSERELEKRIADFYNHKFDILISTTIIESGIDIPNANTMIIDRADTYGLSQLHQLRGRIGRSDRKAYAYFIIPTHKKISDVATKRLKALKSYAEIGSGFSLASSDMEIRGSGDILGAEQSGHLDNIGLELYMELLQEAIREISGNQQIEQFNDIEIINGFPCFIPKEYIEDSSQRIKYYKLLSNKKRIGAIDEVYSELKDQYGEAPQELKNLTQILKTRITLQNTGIDKIRVQSHSVILYFNSDFINSNSEIQSKIINLFMKRPKIYKINPDFSINCKFKDKIDVLTLFEFAKHIAEQIKSC